MENKEDQTIELIEHKENKEKKNEELILYNNEKKSAIYMLISHFLTRMGDNMWEFGIPFILITITPNSLIPSSLFGLLISIIRVIFGTTLGNQIDKKDKLKIITWGTMGQAFSIICSSIFLFLLLEIKDPQLKLNIFYTWKSSILFSLLLISSMIGSLAAMLVDISVERKWVPIAIKTDLYLTLINTRMRQIDLITEVSAPFIAGIILSIPGISFFIGFLIIALFNFITFFPQLFLLYLVYKMIPSLSIISDSSNDINILSSNTNCFTNFFCGSWNPISNIIHSGKLFIKQPTFLIIFSYVLLWFNVLSPHGIVFTAYLNSIGYSSWELGIFRGSGAIFGLIATFLFPPIVSKIGLVNASTIYIIEEAITMLISTFFFLLGPSTIMNFLFLFSILISRCGLYGFEVGEIQFVQQGVPDNIRGRISSVESSLTSLATLIVYISGLIVNNPNNFIYLVWGSTIFICLGAITFLLWRINWTIEIKSHSHNENDTELNEHIYLHSNEQIQKLQENGVHSHLYFRKKHSSSKKTKN